MGQGMSCYHEHEVMLWDFQEVQTADLIAQWRPMTSPHHYLCYENLPYAKKSVLTSGGVLADWWSVCSVRSLASLNIRCGHAALDEYRLWLNKSANTHYRQVPRKVEGKLI